MDGTTQVLIKFNDPLQANALAIMAEDGTLGEVINEKMATIGAGLDDTEAAVHYSDHEFTPHTINFQ